MAAPYQMNTYLPPDALYVRCVPVYEVHIVGPSHAKISEVEREECVAEASCALFVYFEKLCLDAGVLYHNRELEHCGRRLVKETGGRDDWERQVRHVEDSPNLSGSRLMRPVSLPATQFHVLALQSGRPE